MSAPLFPFGQVLHYTGFKCAILWFERKWEAYPMVAR
jgi:hypothetical protein